MDHKELIKDFINEHIIEDRMGYIGKFEVWTKYDEYRWEKGCKDSVGTRTFHKIFKELVNSKFKYSECLGRTIDELHRMRSYKGIIYVGSKQS